MDDMHGEFGEVINDACYIQKNSQKLVYPYLYTLK
jgi:hypothetical protein